MVFAPGVDSACACLRWQWQEVISLKAQVADQTGLADAVHAINILATAQDGKDTPSLISVQGFGRSKESVHWRGGRLFSSWWNRERNRTWSFCADILGVQGVQRNVRCGFRLHPRIAKSEASILIEFTIHSAKKLVVEPPVTVGLSFCLAALHDVS